MSIYICDPAGAKIDPLRALREEDPALLAKEEMRQVQDYFQDCESQLSKVKVQKNTYQPGVWNCGTVLLGRWWLPFVRSSGVCFNGFFFRATTDLFLFTFQAVWVRIRA